MWRGVASVTPPTWLHYQQGSLAVCEQGSLTAACWQYKQAHWHYAHRWLAVWTGLFASWVWFICSMGITCLRYENGLLAVRAQLVGIMSRPCWWCGQGWLALWAGPVDGVGRADWHYEQALLKVWTGLIGIMSRPCWRYGQGWLALWAGLIDGMGRAD